MSITYVADGNILILPDGYRGNAWGMESTSEMCMDGSIAPNDERVAKAVGESGRYAIMWLRDRYSWWWASPHEAQRVVAEMAGEHGRQYVASLPLAWFHAAELQNWGEAARILRESRPQAYRYADRLEMLASTPASPVPPAWTAQPPMRLNPLAEAIRR